MAKENGTPEQAQPATTDLEEYQVSDLVDDATSMDGFNEYMRNKYVYEYKQGNRVIRGLTAKSYIQMGLERGLSTLEIIEDEKKDGVKYTVCVGRVEKDVPKENWETKWGVAYQPYKDSNGKVDFFAFQKALTKATRNAIAQFIKATDQEEAIAIFMSIDFSQSLPQGAPQAELPDAERENARKAMFATFGEKKTELEKLGITEEIFREAMLKEYGVESRGDLTTAQYKNCKAALEIKGFAKWIQNAAPKPEAEQGEQAESQSPF